MDNNKVYWVDFAPRNYLPGMQGMYSMWYVAPDVDFLWRFIENYQEDFPLDKFLPTRASMCTELK